MKEQKPSQKKKKRKQDDKEQSARFIETAERIELVENQEEAFETAVRNIVKVKQN
jgi:hypothetical protein